MKVRVDHPAPGGGRLRLAFSQARTVLTALSPEEVLPVLAAAQAEADRGRWVLGFLAYEAAPAFDPAFRVRPPAAGCPLAWFAVFAAPDPEPAATTAGSFACTPWRLDTGRQEFDRAIATIRTGIAAGDYYQVNYTGRCSSEVRGDGEALFESLLQAQPGGYGCFVDAGPWQLLSVSPELFFDWQTDGRLTTRPMKGTAARHADAAEDLRAARAMQASEKERAENLMIVDLLRNDLAHIAVLGSVRVPQLFAAEALPTAWQMTSTVECRTRPETSLGEVFAALFPCGSVTGAPKIAAMAAIANLEPGPRGIYCGAIGLLRPGGHATFSVGIRSVWLDRRTNSAECGIGSGITLDSSAAAEYAEWLVKRRFLFRASAGFELIETLRLEAGRYSRLDGHRRRLLGSAGHFGFAVAPAALDRTLADLAERHPAGAWRVRLLADRGGNLRAEAHPLEDPPGEVLVMLAPEAVASDDEFLRYKTSERQVYERNAPPPGIFDTLLWNERGHLTEFTRGNLLVELEGRLLTPPLDDGLLPGVLRGELLARGEIVEAPLPVAVLQRASRLWFVNSLRGRLPARLVGGGPAAR